MADRSGLKFLGFIFATVTLAVMLATAMVVKSYADGGYSIESCADGPADRSGFANHSEPKSPEIPQRQRLQISARTTTAITSRPTNRIMIVTHALRRLPQRNRIGMIGPNGLHEMVPPGKFRRHCFGRGQGPTSSKHSGHSGARRRREPGMLVSWALGYFRKPSASRFHCDTLSAIMRVDFIAAELSWA